MAESVFNKAFRMPRPVSIAGRTSTVTNSFVNGIIPVVRSSREEVADALWVLGMSPDDVRCAYCGGPATEWDHLNPIVRGKRPTGFVSEIHNLIPACGKCNQSKGGSDWREWITGSVPLSPASRGVSNLEEKISRIARYEERFQPVRLDFESIVGEDDWREYWKAHARLLEEMRRCDEIASRIREMIAGVFESEEIRKDMHRSNAAPWSESAEQPEQRRQP